MRKSPLTLSLSPFDGERVVARPGEGNFVFDILFENCSNMF